MAKEKEEGGKKTLEERIKQIEKSLKLSKVVDFTKSVVSSGSYMINRATNINGVPKGKVIEIMGPESSGKSTIVLHIIAEFQKAVPEKRAALIDFEHSFDIGYAKSIGVDVDSLLIYQPDNQEDGYNLAVDLATDVCSVIVIDSHTAATPQAVVEKQIGESTIGIQARNNSTFLAKIKGILDKSECTLIGVSQYRTNIGGMGETNVATGGQAWKFYSDMRFRIWKTNDKIKELNRTTLDVVKNKCGRPFGKAEFNIVWGQGIDIMQEILDLAIEANIVKQGGSWFSYGEAKIGQGAENVKTFFSENVEVYEEIKKQLGL